MPSERFQIETERLVLRPPAESDAPEMRAIFGDMRVMEWLDRAEPDDADAVLERARRHTRFFSELWYCMWLVRRRDNGELAGDCGVMPVAAEGPETEIGWRFAPAHWGNGYATEAARAVLEFAYTRTTLDRLIAVTRRDNERSMRVMRKIGMTDRGTGTYYEKELRVFDITRDQWRAAT